MLARSIEWFKGLAASARGKIPSQLQAQAQPHTPVPNPSPSLLAVPITEDTSPKALGLRDVQGTQEGWLRILSADQLIGLAKGQAAIEAMWRQSRLSQATWERDLLPAIRMHAEFVQLMPASEAHHHAHAGGLLAHTLEMVLAAMTWRNGHFLPEGAPVEKMDEQRDEWTYVVFFAALLHDIAKIMTDLRISWRFAGMDSPLRWMPISGSLNQVCAGKAGAQYLVEFTPKSQRDYQSHARLAVMLLQQVAPSAAMVFLSRQPQAFECLTNYLGGQDKTSLVAQIVRRADQASAKQALLSGSRARFGTSNQVALVDLLMQAMRDMLRKGAALPLNRSGAAGWVYDGSIWFVAKRLADSVRKHIKEHTPDEAIPGEQKNDRLFDTWQEHGVCSINPHSGQSIWYVTVHGGADTEVGGATSSNYTHSLSMLRFPLEKIFDNHDQYPLAMLGRIEVKTSSKELAEEGAGQEEQPQPSQESQHRDASTRVTSQIQADAGHTTTVLHSEPAAVAPEDDAGDDALLPPVSVIEKPRNAGRKPDRAAPLVSGPTFNKPRPVAKPVSTPPTAEAVSGSKSQRGSRDVLQGGDICIVDERPKVLRHPRTSALISVPVGEGIDGFDVEDDWLEPAIDWTKPPPIAAHQLLTETAVIHARTAPAASSAKAQPKSSVAIGTPPSAGKTAKQQSARQERAPSVTGLPPIPEYPVAKASPTVATVQRLVSKREPQLVQQLAARAATPAPVVLTPFLPDLPHEVAARKTEPSETAVDFVRWLQTGLAQRKLSYNETGALVHFVPEGMALVSPAIFKEYVASCRSESDPAAEGLQVQREVIQAGWHLVGPAKINILSYQVIGRGEGISKLSAVVLLEPSRWVMPVPPVNAVLRRV